MAPKCGVTGPRGVREPGGVAKRDVKMRRHLPTWRQGARWRGWTWRQNVASFAHAACVKTWPHWPTWRQGARWRGRTWRQNVASLAHVASGRQVASQDVAVGRGVRRCQAPSIYVASQDVASKRGVTKPGFPARVFKMCLQSSGDMCTPTNDHPVISNKAKQKNNPSSVCSLSIWGSEEGGLSIAKTPKSRSRVVAVSEDILHEARARPECKRPRQTFALINGSETAVPKHAPETP